jgi:hypothetical protein
MHLYEAGVPLPYIRDILGHVELSTTEIYARASTEAMRKAFEAAYRTSSPATCPNGTGTPVSSAGLPTSDRSDIMRSARSSVRLSATMMGSALRIS